MFILAISSGTVHMESVTHLSPLGGGGDDSLQVCQRLDEVKKSYPDAKLCQITQGVGSCDWGRQDCFWIQEMECKTQTIPAESKVIVVPKEEK